MSETDELLRNNAEYAAAYTHGALPAPPSKPVAVLTCMDARIDPHRMLGLEEGDAHVIRNAGGVANDDAIRSLVVSQRKLGTREVLVILHTDCGMRTFKEDMFVRELEAETGTRPAWETTAFHVEIDADVRRAVARVRSSPFLLHVDAVRGFVYDVATGRLREVSGDAGAGGGGNPASNRS
ncbi:MAG TPA: carbonic anhydrase [Conexibacter sp.]|nr:carbonic anhydrase [Conexibacter sp.]